MAQIEAVLNSRPLTAMTQDPSDLSVLTPGHFLIGRPLTAVPEPSLDHIKTNRLTKYQRLHQLSRHFWDRWHSEYLVQLQQRHKWKDGATTIQVGKLALIREENVSPLQWRLGRIEEIHPGKDNITRAVTLKTSTGRLTRAVHKISMLPSPEDTNDEEQANYSAPSAAWGEC